MPGIKVFTINKKVGPKYMSVIEVGIEATKFPLLCNFK